MNDRRVGWPDVAALAAILSFFGFVLWLVRGH